MLNVKTTGLQVAYRLLIFILIPLSSIAQNVKNAKELKAALLSNSKNITVIGTINLGDLPSTDFPLIIKKGVSLVGKFDMRKNFTSLIKFPYEFIDGKPCYDNTADYYNDYKGFAFEMKDSSKN